MARVSPPARSTDLRMPRRRRLGRPDHARPTEQLRPVDTLGCHAGRVRQWIGRRGFGGGRSNDRWGTDEPRQRFRYGLAVRRRLGPGCRAPPGPGRRGPRRSAHKLGGVPGPRRPAGVEPGFGRGRAGRAGGAVPVQRPRVPGGLLRHIPGWAHAGQHQLPVPGRRARLPVDQRRRGGGRVPWCLHRYHRFGARPGAHGAAVAVGRRWQRAVPGLGRALRGDREHWARRGLPAPVGPQRRRHRDDLHRWHHRHAQGRDVAP